MDKGFVCRVITKLKPVTYTHSFTVEIRRSQFIDVASNDRTVRTVRILTVHLCTYSTALQIIVAVM